MFCGLPGMGKTTLWWHALDRATSSGGHVLSTRPSEADLALGFGGLADLLTPSADVWMSHIPPHLEDALAYYADVGVANGGP